MDIGFIGLGIRLTRITATCAASFDHVIGESYQAGR
jgi:hypothetical protein